MGCLNPKPQTQNPMGLSRDLEPRSETLGSKLQSIGMGPDHRVIRQVKSALIMAKR